MVDRLGKGDGAGKRLVGWIYTLALQKDDHISIYNEIGPNLGSSLNFQICLKIGFWSKNCNFFTFFPKNASLPPRNDRSYRLKMTIQWLSKLVIIMNSMNNRRNLCYLHNHIHQHWKFAWLAVMFDLPGQTLMSQSLDSLLTSWRSLQVTMPSFRLWSEDRDASRQGFVLWVWGIDPFSW